MFQTGHLQMLQILLQLQISNRNNTKKFRALAVLLISVFLKKCQRELHSFGTSVTARGSTTYIERSVPTAISIGPVQAGIGESVTKFKSRRLLTFVLSFEQSLSMI